MCREREREREMYYGKSMVSCIQVHPCAYKSRLWAYKEFSNQCSFTILWCCMIYDDLAKFGAIKKQESRKNEVSFHFFLAIELDVESNEFYFLWNLAIRNPPSFSSFTI